MRIRARRLPSVRHATRDYVLLATLLLLLGAFFRIHGLTRASHFHADEALFASFARQMVLEGDWNLDQVAVDKPPTSFLIVGTSLHIWGETEFAARLPNVYASLIGLAAFYALVKRCAGHLVAIIALLLLVVCPVEIGYAPTVFQDSPMLAAILLATWLMAGQRWMWGGLMAGLAMAFKPTALWMLPLIVAIGVLQRTQFISKQHRKNYPIKSAILFAVGWLLPVSLTVLWDQTRHAQSFITLGNYNNNPRRFIRAEEVWPRAEIWWNLLADMAARHWLAIIFLLIALLWLGVSGWKQLRSGLLSWLIAIFVLWYMGLYWLIAFNTWDRYVLPILPFVLLVVAQGIGWLITCLDRPQFSVSNSLSRLVKLTAAMILTLILAISWQPARQAVHRSNPAGIAGIDELADTLNRDFAGKIVYDHWLGWYLLWYLGSQPTIHTIYFPTPEDLAHHMQTASEDRYLAAPDAALSRPWLTILENYGIETEPVYQTEQGEFVLYVLHPPDF